jgi:hypothetical protein
MADFAGGGRTGKVHARALDQVLDVLKTCSEKPCSSDGSRRISAEFVFNHWLEMGAI